MQDIDLNDEKISSLIYEINGKNVLLDSDLARLYGVKVEEISEAVEKNSERFPKRFSWVLSDAEMRKIKTRATDEKLADREGAEAEAEKGRKVKSATVRKPRVFTEQGVAILTTILKTDAATKVSLGIMDAFVTMSKYLSEELIAKSLMDDRVKQNTAEIELLKEALKKMSAGQIKNEIYFEGQIYDAYSKISEIFNSATKTLTIIDTYADITTLDIVKRLPEVQVTLITKANNLLTKQDIKKYNLQYHNISVYYDESFHDRYFIVDDEKVYHCGSSLNRIGNKTFSINVISDEEICRLIKAKIVKIVAKADKARSR